MSSKKPVLLCVLLMLCSSPLPPSGSSPDPPQTQLTQHNQYILQELLQVRGGVTLGQQVSWKSCKVGRPLQVSPVCFCSSQREAVKIQTLLLSRVGGCSLICPKKTAAATTNTLHLSICRHFSNSSDLFRCVIRL